MPGHDVHYNRAMPEARLIEAARQLSESLARLSQHQSVKLRVMARGIVASHDPGS
jgi:hypothetical protein